jgi:hypothetical protein
MIKFQRLALVSALGAAFLGFSVAATAAGTGEFCAIPNAQGTHVSVECNVKYLPTQTDWLTQFKTWASANKTNGAMACFGAGTYTVPATLSTANNPDVDTNRLVLRGVKNMKLCAPTGGAIIEHKTVNADASPLTATILIPTLQITDSSGVSIKGMEFRNKSVYATNAAQPVTHAVWASGSANTRLFDVKMSALGKQALLATDASISLSGATLSCAYFCASGGRGNGSIKPTITIAKSKININNTKNAADDHAALWTEFSDFYISDSTFNFTTGEGFVAGKASTVDWVNVSNVVITGTTAQGRSKMFGWIPMNPTYSNLQISHTGSPSDAASFSQYGRPYFCTSYLNSGCETGYESAGNSGSVFRYRETAASAYVTAALPPARTQRLLLVNAAGQDALWSKLAIVKNNPALVSQSIQSWSSVGNAVGGWLDTGDAMLTGDFVVKGDKRALFFNSETLGGAFSVRNLSGTGNSGTISTDLHIDWTPALVNTLQDWHGANDKVLAGDFMGLGRAHLAFVKVSAAGPAVHFAAVDGAAGQLQSLAILPPDSSNSVGVYSHGQAGESVLAGDFYGAGQAQLLFLSPAVYAFSGSSFGQIQKYNAATNRFEFFGSVSGYDLQGDKAPWFTSNTMKIVTGDFLGLNRDQIAFINTSGTGVAISIWAFDPYYPSYYRNYLRELHKMNYSASEIPVSGFNGFLDANDWQLAY